MKLSIQPIISTITFVLISAYCSFALADNIKERLFAEVYLAKQSATEKNASEFAPRSFGRAMKTLGQAEAKYEKGKTVESVNTSTHKAIKQFKKAQFTAEIAQQRLSGLIQAKKDAEAVKAHKTASSPSNWKKAERQYRDAINYLEQGVQRQALIKAKSSQKTYRTLELNAIKAKLLDETRTLIKQAEKAKAKKYAPKTYAKAISLLATAEKELTENRYDIDQPRSLAMEAKYEAQHAIYLSKYIKKKKDSNKTDEDLILEWETPLQQVAAMADIHAHFHNGYQPVANALINYIDMHSARSQEQEQDLLNKNQQISSLNQQVSELSQKLGGVASAEAALKQQLLTQEKIRQKVKEIEQTFTRFEANVFRDSDQIYIRLLGMSFDSGSSNLKPQDFKLLAKVKNAFDIFPNCNVIIEGHTDSFGGDDMNLILSEDRAKSVKDHFVNRAKMPAANVDAVGYGETRPVANNETPQGRAKNRRIDIRIAPNLDITTL